MTSYPVAKWRGKLDGAHTILQRMGGPEIESDRLSMIKFVVCLLQ